MSMKNKLKNFFLMDEEEYEYEYIEIEKDYLEEYEQQKDKQFVYVQKLVGKQNVVSL